MSARGRALHAGRQSPPATRITTGSDVYRAHWEGSGEGLFSVRVLAIDDFVFDGINPPLQLASGLSEATFVGRRPSEVLEPATAARVQAQYRRCVERGARISYTQTLNLPIGRTRWKIVLTPIRDEKGAIVRLVGKASLVVPRHPSPRGLARARRDYQRAIDLSPGHIAVLDASGDVVQVNAAWRHFGQQNGATQDGVGRNYLSICDQAKELPVAGLIARDLRRMLSGRIQTFLSLPYECAGFHFIVRATRVELAGAAHVVLAHQEVTRLFELQRDLRDATGKLLKIQEEERARIGRELHDALSQQLVAIGFGLGELRRSGGDHPALADMKLALAEANRQIRSLTYLLHPPQLAREGLPAMLRAFVAGLERRTDLAIALTLKGALEQIPPEVQQAVFRVVQEALTNVCKHAEASSAKVAVALNGRGLRVAIDDDGRTPLDAGGAVSGVGLSGMAARMHQFGGSLDVRRGKVPARDARPWPLQHS